LAADATISLLHPFTDVVHTITGDNGKEFAEHLRIAETLKANFYSIEGLIPRRSAA